MEPNHFTALMAATAMACCFAAHAQDPLPGGTLDPRLIPKYVTPLAIPPVLYDDRDGARPLDVDVAVRQFSQQVLPPTDVNGNPLPATTLWGYGDPSRPGTFHNPSYTFEVTKNTPSSVKWINQLVADPERCFDDGHHAGSRRNGGYDDNEGCEFLPHIIRDVNGVPVIDQTLHWAAPNDDCRNKPEGATDCRGSTAEPYLGPVPMVVHLHGAHVEWESDGYPEAWWLPAGTDWTDTQYAPAGTYFTDSTYSDGIAGNETPPDAGYAIYRYRNDQPTSTLWYHDHSLGITRLNVYAAGAGFWLIRTEDDSETGLLSGVLPGPPPRLGQDPNGDAAVRRGIREIPLAIQPKSFNADGSQFYPANRAFFEGLTDGLIYANNDGLNIPFLPSPLSDIAPIWNPESFFNTMVVNGNTWPALAVAPERYRFRVVNAADSQFLNLSLQVIRKLADGTEILIGELPFYQIGTEQSLLPYVVRIETGLATPLPGDGRDACPRGYLAAYESLPPALAERFRAQVETTCVLPERATFPEQALLLGPGERADVIVDFSLRAENVDPRGLVARMINTAPDSPFGGFGPDTVPADPATTGQVMEFALDLTGANPSGDPSTPPAQLVLDSQPGGVPLPGAPSVIRDLALLEEESELICATTLPDGTIEWIPGEPFGSNLPPDCPQGGVPFAPKAAVLGYNGSQGGIVQLWDDPIHQNPALYATETWELWNWSADAHPIHLHLVKFEVVNREVIGGPVREPEPSERGWKDTVIAYPGEITRIKATFDIAGLYPWHCHILSHEDNEMMVPYCVGTPGVDCPAELF